MGSSHFACRECYHSIEPAPAVQWAKEEESLPVALQGRCWSWYRRCLLLPVCFQRWGDPTSPPQGTPTHFLDTEESNNKLYK